MGESCKINALNQIIPSIPMELQKNFTMNNIFVWNCYKRDSV